MKIGSEEHKQRSRDRLLRKCLVNWMAPEEGAVDGAQHGGGRRSTLALIAGQAFAPDLLPPVFCRGSLRLSWWGRAVVSARAVPANHA